jgi:hypothetical protein
MVVINHAVWTVTLTPIQLLRRCWVAITLQTVVAPEAISQIARSPKDWQATDDHPFILPMSLADLSPTMAADCPFFGTLNRDDQLANFVDSCTQYPNFGNIQWYFVL